MSDQPKLLHHERVIQLSGVLMMVSPFVNYILSIYPVQLQNKWTWAGQVALLKGISATHWILWSASFVVGSMMLKGRRSSWISVLILLGVFVVYDLASFKSQLQRGWLQPTILLLTNIGVFALVYVQEFRQSAGLTTAKPLQKKTETAPLQQAVNVTAQPTAVSEVANSEIEIDVSSLIGSLVDFEGIGPWAEITQIQENMVTMKPLTAAPLGIEGQALQIYTGDFVLNLRFALQGPDGYTFVCESFESLNANAVA